MEARVAFVPGPQAAPPIYLMVKLIVFLAPEFG
jgi:hypothetical protein